MFGLFKFLKLNSVLHDCNISSGYQNRINIDVVDQNRKLLDTTTEKGKENLGRLLQILYQNHPASSRVKLLIMIHRLICRQATSAEFFLEQPKKQFQGVKILKRNRSTSKKTDTSTRSPDNSLNKSVNKSRGGTSRNSVDEDILFDDVNVYLHVYLVQPYFNYLMKLCVHYDLYEQCKHNINNQKQPDFVMIWKLINLIKSVTPIRAVLTHIGRYYLSENSYIVDFLQAITRDVYYFYRMIQSHISVALASFTKSDKLSMQNILKLIDQMIQLNESLFEIYYSRYFYKLIQHCKSPKWVTLTNEQIEMMTKFYEMKYGEGKKRRNVAMTLSHNRDKKGKALNFEDVNMSFGAV